MFMTYSNRLNGLCLTYKVGVVVEGTVVVGYIIGTGKH